MAKQEDKVRIEFEERQAGRIARIVIDRDHKLNALSSAIMSQFVEKVDQLGSLDDLRVVILTSAGSRAFIGGADISEMVGLEPFAARQFITKLHKCCSALRNLPVPVIARIQGVTFGGGLEIAAACDLRIASESACFGMPEVKLGIPSVIEAALLPMLVGWGRTRQMLLLGETFTASEASEWGLVERVVPLDELDGAVEEWTSSLLTTKPRAIRLQKALISAWEDLPLRAAVQAGVDTFAAAWMTDEPKKAMSDFLQHLASRKGRA